MLVNRSILHKTLAFLFISILLAGGVSLATAQERRVALVIGNGNYAGLQQLQNPVRDAEAVGQSLSALGFTVFLTTEVDQRQLRKAIRFFLSRAADADTALFYFAGHGATLAGQTYLFPTDFGKDGFFDISESINLEEIVAGLNSELRTNLIFLDACRNNPLQSGTAETISFSPSPFSLNAARIGTLISYATTPGQTAYDGDGPHSPFTGALLDHLETPGVDIELMLKRVRRDVVVNTRGQQVPWTETSLLTAFQMVPQSMAASDIKTTAQKGKSPPLLAILSDSGFKQKPILDVISGGLGQETATKVSSTGNPENRSLKIKKLLCSIITPPLPERCLRLNEN
jgi:uncharacterized caspase-like protein